MNKYEFTICMVHDSVGCLERMKIYQDEGWETISVFTNENGILCIALRKEISDAIERRSHGVIG